MPAYSSIRRDKSEYWGRGVARDRGTLKRGLPSVACGYGGQACGWLREYAVCSTGFSLHTERPKNCSNK